MQTGTELMDNNEYSLEWLVKSNAVYVLGADYRMNGTISVEDAVTDILQGTKTMVIPHPKKRIRTSNRSIDIPEPLVVLDKKWNKGRSIKKSSNSHPKDYAPRTAILRRDKWKCCYCLGYGDTIDHVRPKSWCKKEGYPHNGSTWDNMVTACKKHNNQKSNHLPEEVGLTMHYQPTVGALPTAEEIHASAVKSIKSVLETGNGILIEPILVEGIIS